MIPSDANDWRPKWQLVVGFFAGFGCGLLSIFCYMR